MTRTANSLVFLIECGFTKNFLAEFEFFVCNFVSSSSVIFTAFMLSLGSFYPVLDDFK